MNPTGLRSGALLTLCVAASTQAGQLVCKDKIIDTGTPAAEVLAARGEPVSKKVETRTVRDAGARGPAKHTRAPTRPGATSATFASSRRS
jgi:hypothetical protein